MNKPKQISLITFQMFLKLSSGYVPPTSALEKQIENMKEAIKTRKYVGLNSLQIEYLRLRGYILPPNI